MNAKTIASLLCSSVTLLAGLLIAPASAHAGALWRVGAKDGAGATAPQASDEFAQGLGSEGAVELTIDPNSPFDDSPAIPGYLYDSESCSSCAEAITIHFSLDRDYVLGELRLNVARYGSEETIIYVDEVEYGAVRVSESNGALFKFALDDLDQGAHSITLVYDGGGSNNGNHLDYVELFERTGSGEGGVGTNTLWGVGQWDGELATSLQVKDEFAWTGAWQNTLNYDLDDPSHDSAAPNVPGMLALEGVQSEDAVEKIKFGFDLAQGYDRGELMLSYARQGAEVDQILLNGAQLGRVRAREQRWVRAEFVIPDVSAGANQISCRLVDNPEFGDGFHVIDMLSLSEL